MDTPKVGLLPFYLALYDEALPERRPQMEQFRDTIAAALRERGLAVEVAPVCRLASEFSAAVSAFERAGVDAVVTLHLAYSPSLESSATLSNTSLPLIVLDTTPTWEFGPNQDPDEIMRNHGIHGVQDLCNLLLRDGKPFQIEAGHWERSDVLDRVARWAHSARLVTAMRTARVGRIGRAFRGMGDFAVPPETLRDTIGTETVPADPHRMGSLVAQVSDAEVDAEIAADREAFDTTGLDVGVYRETTRACLAVRRWIEEERLTAFSMNFMEVDSTFGLHTVPFLEASKAMTRGLGYAGEGDVLTAALVRTLLSAFPDTTFTEMFCPDWAGNRIFLSHMGEVNLRLLAGKPRLIEKPFPWTDAANPAVAVGRLRGGPALFTDVAPGPDDTYTLILAPVEVADVEGEDRFADSIRGWIRPALPVDDFLEAYSRVGGTHHAALVYTEAKEATPLIGGFGRMIGWKVVVLE